ncbi:MAG: hypothetical protein E3J66_02325 [Dehalococcoidia bacterium]|nr:MAG: hypothetical protein E3J66_02325 [Dehalococcoidia bacterium]
MREMGFSRKDWMNYSTITPKFQEAEFTTFRLPRRDRDWKQKEIVKIVYQPRGKSREVLGTAKIIIKQPKYFFYSPHGLFKERIINDNDAKKDGFQSSHEMYLAMVKMHGRERIDGSFLITGPYDGKINKLTLRWMTHGNLLFNHRGRPIGTGRPIGGRRNK